MKKFLLVFIALVLFSGVVYTQEKVQAPCPTVSVSGPSIIPKPNEVIVFTATVAGDTKNIDPGYKWSVSSGELIKGQGTREISVRLNALISVTATVEITGFPKVCQNIASETISDEVLSPEAVLVDEFGDGCPKVAVETSFISVIDGYPMIFTARITGAGKRKLQYKWTLSNGGGILEGQGTPGIKVETLGYQGEEIKATITIRSLSKRCKNKASATGFVKPKPYLN